MNEELLEVLSKCTEEELFTFIHEISYCAWWLGHEAADGRIEDGPKLQGSIDYWNGLTLEGIKQTVRFNIKPFKDEKHRPTDEYIEWYERCKRLYSNG